MKPSLFQIRPDALDEVVRGGLRRAAAPPTRERMFPDVILEHLGHQPVHRAARGGDQAQHIPAWRVAVERTRDGVHLAADSGDAVCKAGLVLERVGHKDSIAPGLCNSNRRTLPGHAREAPVPLRKDTFWLFTQLRGRDFRHSRIMGGPWTRDLSVPGAIMLAAAVVIGGLSATSGPDTDDWPAYGN